MPASLEKTVYNTPKTSAAASWSENVEWRKRGSTRLWGIQWDQHFPHVFGSGRFTAVISDFQRVGSFMREHGAEINAESADSSPFLWRDVSPAKMRFYEEYADLIGLYDADRMIGILTGNPLDWGTYYLRSISILPEYQNQRVFQPFFEHFLAVLAQYPIERAEAEVSSCNRRQVHVLNKFGFNVTGTGVSERWGAMTRFTRYFSSHHEQVYLDQFCFGIRPGQPGRTRPVTGHS